MRDPVGICADERALGEVSKLAELFPAMPAGYVTDLRWQTVQTHDT